MTIAYPSLAGRPLPREGGPDSHVHPGMRDLLDRLGGTPARVITDLHVTLVQNTMARALLGDPAPHTGMAASFVHRWFTDPSSRGRYPAEDHPRHSRSFAADLRAAVARRGVKDREATEMVADLLERSREFAGLWARHDVAVRRDDRKRIVHPSVGVIELNCLHLLSEDGRQRLLWFSPVPDTDSAEKLELLRVIGTQDFVSG